MFSEMSQKIQLYKFMTHSQGVLRNMFLHTVYAVQNSKEQRWEAKPACRELAAFASAVQKNEASSEYFLLQMGTDVENWFGSN